MYGILTRVFMDVDALMDPDDIVKVLDDFGKKDLAGTPQAGLNRQLILGPRRFAQTLVSRFLCAVQDDAPSAVTPGVWVYLF